MNAVNVEAKLLVAEGLKTVGGTNHDAVAVVGQSVAGDVGATGRTPN
jgi:hypothetical protein